MTIYSTAPLAGPGLSRLETLAKVVCEPWTDTAPPRFLSDEEMTGRLNELGARFLIIEADFEALVSPPHLVLLVASCALFAGVVGKSGQFPLHTWLPDAMAGPTPVSALIHAATMVAAGVYFIARLLPVFEASRAAMIVLAVMAAVTMAGSALAALAQDDIKRVLAYSTIGQLGYMTGALPVADRVQFVRRNLYATKISEATVVTMYLSTDINTRLEPKLRRELRPGTRIVSHQFRMGDWEPEQHFEVGGKDIYFWTIPANPRSTGTAQRQP